MRFILALQCFFALLFTGRLPTAAAAALPPPADAAKERERLQADADALRTRAERAERERDELRQAQGAAAQEAKSAAEAASGAQARLEAEVARLSQELSDARARELKLGDAEDQRAAAAAELDKLRARLEKAEGKLSEAHANGALALLGWLQREGRLLDFLREAIDDYEDEQVGAAVRAIHKGCRKVLDEALALEPILPGEEETPVTVPAGFDPVAIALSGNVKGDPPFKGTLMHHGWRTSKVHVPVPETDPRVLTPAEVEL